MSTTTLTTLTAFNGSTATLKRHLSDVDTSIDDSKAKRRKTSTKSVCVKAQRIVYRPSENLFDVFQPGKTVKVFIPLKYLLMTDVERKVWGTDVYTDDSDLIAACQHDGKFKLNDFLNTGDAKNGAASTTEVVPSAYTNGNHTSNGGSNGVATVSTSSIKGVIVGVKILNPLRKYNSTFRNNIRSRSWNYYNGNAYSIETFKIVRDQPKSKDGSKSEKIIVKKHALAEDVTESEHKRFLPNVTVVYNLCNEPCLKYSLNMIADRGYNYQDYTSHRLCQEVIYLENQSTRYELCQVASKTTDENGVESSARYRWSRVLNPFSMSSSIMRAEYSIPLAPEHLDVIHSDLLWPEFQWGIQSVAIRGVTYNVANIKIEHEGKCTTPTTKDPQTFYLS